MLNEQIALGILQASITGAGLVLAIYALIIPLTKQLFEWRAKTSVNLWKKLKESIGSENEIKDGEKLKKLVDQITETQNVPDYLRVGVGGTFFGYVLCTLLSYAVIVNWQRPASDDWLSLTFVISTFVFLIVGLIAIKDIHRIMKKDLTDLRKSLVEN